MRFAALFIAMLGLVLGQVVPAGFMPAVAADGTVTITACTGEGRVAQALTPDNPLYAVLAKGKDSEQKQPDQADGAHSCHFAGGNGAADLPTPLSLDAAMHRAMPPAFHTPHTLTGIFPTGLPPATGPPAFS